LFIDPSPLRHASRKCDSYDRHNLYGPSTADFELDALALPDSTEEIQRFELGSERESPAVDSSYYVLRLYTCSLCRAAVRDVANEEPDHGARRSVGRVVRVAESKPSGRGRRCHAGRED
jgi:hypothetical protein